MTDRSILHQLQEISEKGGNGMPQEYYNQLIISALFGIMERQDEYGAQISKHIDQSKERQESMEVRLRLIEDRLDYNDEYREKHRPLIWYFRYKTERTLLIIATAFVIMTAIYVSDLRQFFLGLLGLPTNILPPIK